MKHPYLFLLAIASIVFSACGEDRAGEQPFAPTVKTVSAISEGDSCIVEGQVLTSPNSSITAVGFVIGNDTLQHELAADSVMWQFSTTARSLNEGEYYVCAFATNGIGTTYGDTLRFEVIY